MKAKNLKKKIRSLETRLQKGTKKLAKLKRKLQAAIAASADKSKKNSASGNDTRQAKPSTRAQKKKAPAEKAPVKGNKAKRGTARKVKRKLNLSPERRAQLAAAMKARWAVKRAGQGNAQTAQDFTLGQTPQA